MNTQAPPSPEFIQQLPLSAITVRPQVRICFDKEKLAVLAANIKEVGIQVPLICHRQTSDIVLLDGERRFRAAPLAGLDRVPALVLGDRLSAADVLARQLSCDLHEDLNIVERAEGIKQFMLQTHLTADQAAGKLGFSASTACRTLAVLRLPEPLRQRAAAGELSADVAYLLVRVCNPAQQAELADWAMSGQLTRDQLAARVRALEAGKAPESKPAPASVVSESTASKPSLWRMTRSIGRGVALAVSGDHHNGKLDSVIDQVQEFLMAARDARSRGVSLARFLSTFRHDVKGDGATAQGVAA